MRRAPGVIARAALLVTAALPLGAAPVAEATPPSGPPIVKTTGAKLGEQLFAANCARCHGIDGRGISESDNPAYRGPSLHGVGAMAADFYLRTGYMPLAAPDRQPVRARVRFDEREVRALTAYVASLGNGPPVPHPNPKAGGLSEGFELFTEHCAGCHQVVAEGGAVTGAKAPPLNRATPTQIAEAVRIGPYVMPKYSTRDISDAQLNSIIAYVLYARDPRDEGGWGISHLGPFPEGMVTWLIAIVVLVATCMVIGKRMTSR